MGILFTPRVNILTRPTQGYRTHWSIAGVIMWPNQNFSTSLMHNCMWFIDNTCHPIKTGKFILSCWHAFQWKQWIHIIPPQNKLISTIPFLMSTSRLQNFVVYPPGMVYPPIMSKVTSKPSNSPSILVQNTIPKYDQG